MRTVDEAARIALILDAAARPDFDALRDACFRGGDTGERCAVLRALPLLPGRERFVPIAVEACRSNVLPVFEAIACENPYPARHFAEASFNQMVLKAVFMGVALDRLHGLDARRGDDLARMARDYASERRAAGRGVPADLERLLTGGD